MADSLARTRHPLGKREHEAAEGVDRVLLVTVEQPDRQVALQLIHPHACIRLHRAVVQMDQGGGLDLVVLVFDFADDFLHDILDRHQAVGAAVFVDDHRHMQAGLAHFLEQRGNRHGFGHEQDVAPDCVQVEGAVLAPMAHDVADVDHADDVVQIAAIERHARMPLLLDRGDDLVEGRGNLDRRDVVAGHHRVFCCQPPEAEKVEQQVALVGADLLGDLFLRKDLAEGLAPRHAVAAAEPLAQPIANKAHDRRANPPASVAAGTVAARWRFVVVAHCSASAVVCRGACPDTHRLT